MSAAFKIGDTEYAIPTSFTLADGPLVYEASGLEFSEWADRMDSLQDDSADMLALTGLVAIAVSRGNPKWSRRQVVQFLGQVDLQDFQIEGGDETSPPAAPPTTADTGKPSQDSSTGSTASPGAMSGVPV